MSSLIHFPEAPDLSHFAELRAEIRNFLQSELGSSYSAVEQARSWNGFDADFSRKLGKRGWLGMTLPKAYGGHERGALERYVVVEELLAAGAPVAAHWIADRQSAPLLLRYGSERQKQSILPRIAAGACYFCIGMSEPDSGSDLAATRTLAEPTPDGYRINGTKLWTTYAQHAHYMTLFCRTDRHSKRQEGTSQFLIDLSTPGITISPIFDIAGEHHLNEVHFDNVLVDKSALLGEEGQGWNQVMGELAFERSGPDRFLSSFALINELLRVISNAPDLASLRAIGRLTVHLMVLRQMSMSVAGMLAAGENPSLQATIVKDLGAILEQDIPEIVRSLIPVEPIPGGIDPVAASLARVLLAAPSFSLRGGTREILRGIIARGLGLR